MDDLIKTLEALKGNFVTMKTWFIHDNLGNAFTMSINQIDEAIRLATLESQTKKDMVTLLHDEGIMDDDEFEEFFDINNGLVRLTGSF